jgi:hypothetical protein
MGRYPGSGFESSVDECSTWCSIMDAIDTDRRSCRPESRARTHREAASRCCSQESTPRDQEDESVGRA